jgi:hypothetical protein
MKKVLARVSSICLVLFLVTQSLMADPGTVFFADLWSVFQTEEELQNAKQETPDAKDTLAKEGCFYYLQATGLPQGDKDAKVLLEKSIAIFTKLRKQDRQDYRNMIRLAYALSAICGTGLPFEDLLENITKANGFFSTAIDHLPENIDARLGRIYLNIHLTPETGRPDDILLDDALVYLSGYEQLSPETQSRPDVQMGAMAARLAAVIIWDARGEESQVLEQLRLIESSWLEAAGLTGKYEELAKRY